MDQQKQRIRDFMASRSLTLNNLLKKPNNKKENNNKKRQQARENFKRGANMAKREREAENRLKREREVENRLKREREAENRRKKEALKRNRAMFRNTFNKLISNKKMTEKQAAIKLAKNLLGVNIPNKEFLNRKVFLLIHPNRGNSNNRNIRTLVTSVLTRFKKDS